jgi:RES domain-containing protein
VPVCYRLHRAVYAPSSGEGARRFGGRWNRQGVSAIYAAETRALCILERLVHMVRLPQDEVFTRIVIPDSVRVCEICPNEMSDGWNNPVESPETQTIGFEKMTRDDAVVLFVPSVIVARERCLVMNPEHRDFGLIEFGEPEEFSYDHRLVRYSG